jgi:rare lipoprotein A (peptidoglycan hydrolase)
LGEKQLSALAEQESAAAAERLAAKNNGATSQQIRWVDPQTFAATSRTATDVTNNPVSATAAEMPTGMSPPSGQPAQAPRSDVKAAAASSSAFKPFWQRKQE